MKSVFNFAIFTTILIFSAHIAFAQTPTTLEGWYKLGYEQIGKKQYDAAVKSFTECIKLNAKADGCFRGRATAQLLVKNNEQAQVDAEQALALNPKDDISYTVRGDVYKRLGKYQQSVADYSSAIGLKPSAILYFARGGSYSNLNNHQAAIDDFTKAISLNPEFYAAYGNRGSAYFSLGKYESAIADFTKLIQSDPSNAAKTYVERGRAYDKLNKDQEAINDYTKAISLDPKYDWAFNNRGVVYEKSNKYEQAIADYSKAIELDPKTAMFYRNRGNAFYEQKKYDQAIADLKKAVEIDPKFAWAYNNLGNVYSAQKKYAEATASFSKAIELSPKYAVAFYNLGLISRDQKNYEKAVGQFSKAIEFDDKYLNAYKERGDALTNLKKLDEALKDYQKLVELEPKNADRYVDRGAAYERLKNPQKSFEDYKKAIELNPKHHIAYFNLASYYFNEKTDYAQAVANLDKSLEYNPEYGNSYRARSIIYCKQGKTALATADEKKSEEFGVTITKPCASKTASATVPTTETAKKTDESFERTKGFDNAKKEVTAKNYAAAFEMTDKLLDDAQIIGVTRGIRGLEIARLLTEAKQYESALKLLGKIPTIEGINENTQTNVYYLAGNIYFIDKKYVKAIEFYDKIPNNLDARRNKIKVLHQQNKHKEAAETVASTLELLGQNFYAAKTNYDKQMWFDATNSFMKDSWGLANQYAQKPESKNHALTIYKAMFKIVPAESPDGKKLGATIKEIENK